jgi:hypothetical protein
VNKKIILVLGLLLMPVAALAQTQNASSSAEMKKLEFLTGEWKGEGWIEFGPGQRRTFVETELVQSKIGGQVLLIEGLGKSKAPGQEKEIIIHNAMAMICYDAKLKQLRFRAYQAGGRNVESEAKAANGALEWGLEESGRTMRFIIKLDDAGRWFEIGEVSMDGKQWRKFFEMTLQRVK